MHDEALSKVLDVERSASPERKVSALSEQQLQNLIRLSKAVHISSMDDASGS